MNRIVRVVAMKFKAILHIIKYRHGFVVSMSTEEVVNIIKGNDFTVDVYKYSCDDYIMYSCITQLSKMYDDIDLQLLKAKLEAEAEIKHLNKIK